MKSKKLFFFHYRLDEIDLKCGPRDLTRKVRLACCSIVENINWQQKQSRINEFNFFSQKRLAELTKRSDI